MAIVDLKAIKLLEEHMEKLHCIGFSNAVLAMTPKAEATKVKIDKWDHIKLKNFCAAKETTVKKQHIEREKTFSNCISDKGLVYKIYK